MEKVYPYFSEYCTASAIHGVKYIGERGRSRIERIFWLIVVCILMWICVDLIMKSYHKWQTSPIIVTFATTETPIWEIPFPAITICPVVKTNPKVFNYTVAYLKKLNNTDLTAEEEKFFNSMVLICPETIEPLLERIKNKSLTVDDEAIRNLVLLFESVKINEKISAWWQGKLITEDYTYTLTEAGICISYNMISSNDIVKNPFLFSSKSRLKTLRANQWFVDTGYVTNADIDAYPKRTFVAGEAGGLLIQIVTVDSHLCYTCGDGVQGFKVMIHHPFDPPNVQTNFRVQLDEYVQIGVRPKLISTAPSLLHYDPHVRHCIYAHQRKLRYFNNYTQASCIKECIANYTLKKCDCLPIYFPKDNNTPTCGLGSYTCINDYKELMGINNKTFSDCDCLPKCTYLEYSSEISQCAWDWKLFYSLPEIANYYHNISHDAEDMLEEFHASSLVVYYKELQFMGSEKRELYGYVEFFSSTGGLLGLFLGCSVASVIEILYFFTVRIICNVRKSERLQRIPSSSDIEMA